MTTIDHTCIRVLDLDRSAAFYRDALGLTPVRPLDMPDRGWQLLFLGDGTTDFQLELCRETNRTEPYHLGDDTPRPPHPGLRRSESQASRDGPHLRRAKRRHLLYQGPRRAHPGDPAAQAVTFKNFFIFSQPLQHFVLPRCI